MGLIKAVFQGVFSLIMTIVLPLTGNSVARSNGIYLLLMNENIIIVVGLTISFLIFIKEYADKRLKFKGLIKIGIVTIEIWYFLLFIGMISSVSIPDFNTHISIQYMESIIVIPSHLFTLVLSLISSSNVSFPILGDLIMLSFGLILIRTILGMFGERKFSQQNQKEISKNEIKS